MTPVSIVLSDKVSSAFSHNTPIVALESTVITHGLPYPLNFDTLSRLEETIYDNGCVPATIAVIDGKAHIGLSEQDKDTLKERMTDTATKLMKVSMRDIALALAQGKTGGTTVSATMLLAHLAGIKVFATGGIGGVHRDWQSIPDISMDIKALSEIPVVVVSAGCKAILDIPATLEMLETNAVPVLGWMTDKFPCFYSSTSTYFIDSISTELEFTAFYYNHLEYRDKPSGILIANPIPAAAQIPAETIEPQILNAIDTAKSKNITGKALTPFLLDCLSRLTEGESVRANLALLENNAILAARLAKSIQGDL